MLIVSQYVERAYATELLADGRGGLGYLLKDRSMDVAQPLSRPRADSPLEALPSRDLEVPGLMAEGRSSTAIAARLVLTVGAVEKHVANILTKLRLPPSTEHHRRVLAVVTYLRGS